MEAGRTFVDHRHRQRHAQNNVRRPLAVGTEVDTNPSTIVDWLDGPTSKPSLQAQCFHPHNLSISVADLIIELKTRISEVDIISPPYHQSC